MLQENYPKRGFSISMQNLILLWWLMWMAKNDQTFTPNLLDKKNFPHKLLMPSNTISTSLIKVCQNAVRKTIDDHKHLILIVLFNSVYRIFFFKLTQQQQQLKFWNKNTTMFSWFLSFLMFKITRPIHVLGISLWFTRYCSALNHTCTILD